MTHPLVRVSWTVHTSFAIPQATLGFTSHVIQVILVKIFAAQSIYDTRQSRSHFTMTWEIDRNGEDEVRPSLTVSSPFWQSTILVAARADRLVVE